MTQRIKNILTVIGITALALIFIILFNDINYHWYKEENYKYDSILKSSK